MNNDCTKPGLECSPRFLYRQMSLLARVFMFYSNRFENKRFLWRLAPVLLRARNYLSKVYGYRIPRMVSEKIQNCPFVLSGSIWNGLASGIYWGGMSGFEPHETSLFANLASNYKTMFDIGANVGWFSLIASTINKDIKILAFEPNPIVYKILSENFKMNNVNGEVLNTAVSDSSGELLFFISEDDWASSLIPDSTRSRKLCVPSITIDDIIDKYDLRPDFIKVDVEGSESAVFKGASRCLCDFKPDILFEISPKITSIEGLLTLFNNYGYRNFWTFSNEGIVRDDHMGLCIGRATINYITSRSRIL